MPKRSRRKAKAGRPPQAPLRAASPADRTLEELGGIAGLLQTLTGAWPKKSADFEAVFDLVVHRCRIEFGAGRFLAYLCRALLHEQAYRETRRTVPPLRWALAAERVKHAAYEAFQAPSFADDIALARGLAEAINDPGPRVVETRDGRILPDTTPSPWGPLARRQRDLMMAAGRRLLSPPKGAPRVPGAKRRRKPSKPDPTPGLGRLRREVERVRRADALGSTVSCKLGLSLADAAKVAEWNPDRIATALLAAEEQPSLVGKGLAAIRDAERNMSARKRRWSLHRERQKIDTHLSRAQK